MCKHQCGDFRLITVTMPLAPDLYMRYPAGLRSASCLLPLPRDLQYMCFPVNLTNDPL
jgi:hypothetical protein